MPYFTKSEKSIHIKGKNLVKRTNLKRITLKISKSFFHKKSIAPVILYLKTKHYTITHTEYIHSVLVYSICRLVNSLFRYFALAISLFALFKRAKSAKIPLPADIYSYCILHECTVCVHARHNIYRCICSRLERLDFYAEIQAIFGPVFDARNFCYKIPPWRCCIFVMKEEEEVGCNVFYPPAIIIITQEIVWIFKLGRVI